MGQQSQGYQPNTGYGGYNNSNFQGFNPYQSFPNMGGTGAYAQPGYGSPYGTSSYAPLGYGQPNFGPLPAQGTMPQPSNPFVQPSYLGAGQFQTLPMQLPQGNPLGRGASPSPNAPQYVLNTGNPAMPNPVQTAQNTQGLNPGQIGMGSYLDANGRLTF